MKTIDELVSGQVAGSLEDWNARCDFHEKKDSIKKLQEMWRSNAEKLDTIGGLERLTKETIDELIKYEIQVEKYFNIYIEVAP